MFWKLILQKWKEKSDQPLDLLKPRQLWQEKAQWLKSLQTVLTFTNIFFKIPVRKSFKIQAFNIYLNFQWSIISVQLKPKISCAHIAIIQITIKVRKSQKQFMVSSILPKNKQKYEKKFDLTVLWYLRLNFICSFFGRNDGTIIWFWDLLTFSNCYIFVTKGVHFDNIILRIFLIFVY